MLSPLEARRSKRSKRRRPWPAKVRDSIAAASMPALVARRCFVSGLVQGVFYRASARQRAVELGVSGFAANLPDGRVEVLVVGQESATGQLIEWLKRGPPAARVTAVEVHEIDPQSLSDVPAGFTTR
jgi:acylphosphatase